jgi:hypothetical protein
MGWLLLPLASLMYFLACLCAQLVSMRALPALASLL